MKRIKRLGAMIICLAVMLGCMPVIPAKAFEGAMLSVRATDSTRINYNYSETKTIGLTVKNTGSVDLQNIQIAPRVNESIDSWPFEIENKDYTYTISELKAGAEEKVEFQLTARENVSTRYYCLPFDYTAFTADHEEGKKPELDGELGIYVKTVAKPEEKPQDNTGNQTPSNGQEQQVPGGDDAAAPGVIDAGGVTNVEPVSTGGSGSASIPRVIVTGFTTNPSEVKAGTNFTLTIHLKNTAKNTAVTNMLFDLSAPTEGTDQNTASPAFLPASGSSSIYLEKIKAGGTQDISIELNAKADLVQKPYSIELSMKYEDTQGGQFEGASAISIPVKQDARFEFSEFEISPNMISVGEEANIMCELYNLGRVKLYNVKAKFEGNGIKTEEVFVGNIESGATASIDGMVTAESATNGPENMKMTLSYEDESGKVTTTEKEFQLEVTEAMEDMGAMGMEDGMMEETGFTFPIVPIIVAVLIIAAAAAGIIIYKKKKKRRMEEEEEGLVDEFDRLTEDEHRES